MVTPHEVDKSAESRTVELPEESRKPEGVGPQKKKSKSRKFKRGTKPSFGESLNIGFSGKNSRGRVRRRVGYPASKSAGADDTAFEEPLEMEELDSKESTVTDLDDETIIEWDSGSSKPSDASDTEEEIDREEELFCRNCDDLIEFKYIKYYTKKEDNERIKVKGPFCSKLCSLEFSEPEN
jgi:hypothetical protein